MAYPSALPSPCGLLSQAECLFAEELQIHSGELSEREDGDTDDGKDDEDEGEDEDDDDRFDLI